MKRLNGIAASKGIAIGRLFFYENSTMPVEPGYAQCSVTEWQRFENARIRASEMLRDIHQQALPQVGGNESMIFEIHQMMMSDDDYLNSVRELIQKSGFTAEYAVQQPGTGWNRCSWESKMVICGKGQQIYGILPNVCWIFCQVGNRQHFLL